MEKAERQIALLRQQIDFLKEQQQQAVADQEGYQKRAAEIREQMAQTESEAAGAGVGAVGVRGAKLPGEQQDHEAAQGRVGEAEAQLEAVREPVSGERERPGARRRRNWSRWATGSRRPR